MESNQDLFRQAILDAKAVRETSLATARTTLAEHFEPLVKSMFKETVEGIEEAESTATRDDHAEKAGKKVAKDMEWDEKHHKMHESDMESESTLDEILAELDALSEDDTDGSELDEQTTTTAGYDEKAHTVKGETGMTKKQKRLTAITNFTKLKMMMTLKKMTKMLTKMTKLKKLVKI
jgi:hypothetical protein